MANKNKVNILTGAALLTAIATAEAAEPHYALMTADEAADAVSRGLAEQNPQISQDGAFATRLTDAGRAELASLNGQTNPIDANAPAGGADPAAASAPRGGFEIEDNIPVPGASGRGGRGGSIYPFDALAVNQSFHVPATAENPNPAKSLASTVSSATARYAEETGETETVTVAKYKTDDAGKRVKENGHFVKIGEETMTRPKMRETRKFRVAAVDERDPKGKGARVWRVA